jgi:hypothetical protein
MKEREGREPAAGIERFALEGNLRLELNASRWKGACGWN